MGDAELVEDGGTVMSVGERLRTAREAAELSLEDIATSTRIPTRHLESLESGDFSRLPAPTYTIGFAKNYAAAVGLDRTEIGDQLRAEMGGSRPAMTTPAEVFEPADPARAMPKWLIIGTIVALLLAALAFNWLNRRSLENPGEVAATNFAAPVPIPTTAAPQGQGQVVINATDTAWIEVKDGSTILMQGELAPGASFEVPMTAVAPTLTTAKPEALRINVGSTVAQTIGDPGTRVTVSLKGDDLLRPRPSTTAPQPRSTPSRGPTTRPATQPSGQSTASPAAPVSTSEPEPSPQQ